VLVRELAKERVIGASAGFLGERLKPNQQNDGVELVSYKLITIK